MTRHVQADLAIAIDLADNDLDLVVGDVEEPVCLDHLETLVHQGGAVDGDLGAHIPGWVRQRIARADIGQLIQRPVAPVGIRWQPSFLLE